MTTTPTTGWARFARRYTITGFLIIPVAGVLTVLQGLGTHQQAEALCNPVDPSCIPGAVNGALDASVNKVTQGLTDMAAAMVGDMFGFFATAAAKAAFSSLGLVWTIIDRFSTPLSSSDLARVHGYFLVAGSALAGCFTVWGMAWYGIARRNMPETVSIFWRGVMYQSIVWTAPFLYDTLVTTIGTISKAFVGGANEQVALWVEHTGGSVVNSSTDPFILGAASLVFFFGVFMISGILIFAAAATTLLWAFMPVYIAAMILPSTRPAAARFGAMILSMVLTKLVIAAGIFVAVTIMAAAPDPTNADPWYGVGNLMMGAVLFIVLSTAPWALLRTITPETLHHGYRQVSAMRQGSTKPFREAAAFAGIPFAGVALTSAMNRAAKAGGKVAGETAVEQLRTPPPPGAGMPPAPRPPVGPSGSPAPAGVGPDPRPGLPGGDGRPYLYTAGSDGTYVDDTIPARPRRRTNDTWWNDSRDAV